MKFIDEVKANTSVNINLNENDTLIKIDAIKTGAASLVNTIDTSSGSNNYRLSEISAILGIYQLKMLERRFDKNDGC